VRLFASQHLHRSALVFGIAATLLSSGSFAQTSTQSSSQTENPSAAQTSLPTPPATPSRCKSNPPTAATRQPPPCIAKPNKSDISLSLGAFSQLTIDRTQDLFGFAVQGTAPSAGTLGTFRQTFSPWLGYSVNLGYTRVSEQYRNEAGSFGSAAGLNIGSNMYETSLTYIAHTSANKRLSLFGDIGPGLSTFLPVHRGANAINYAPENFASLIPGVQVRPTGVFGSGVDIHLTHHFDLRAEYRGLVYNNPDFRTGDTLSKKLTLTSEPTISLVYHFHASKP
jgi:hypothetical protein